MAKQDQFHSLEINIEKEIYKVNGRDISESGKKLHLDFSDGQCSLVITEDTIYSSDPIVKE